MVMGGIKDTLRRQYWEGGYKMRDEPSDDGSEWYAVTVERARVTELVWIINLRVP